MRSSIRSFDLQIQSAGVCTAAGGLSGTVARMDFNAVLPGVHVLDEFDFTGEAIAAVPACRPALPRAGRLGHMVRSAARDLSNHSMQSLTALGAERLFIVKPESGTDADASALIALQTWLDECGVPPGSLLTAAAKRATFHDDAATALTMARSYLAGGTRALHAVVLCAETWLTPAALQRLDSANLVDTSSSGGVVPGEAAVILRLSVGTGAMITCAAALEVKPRCHSEAPLGTLISEMTFAVTDARASASDAGAPGNTIATVSRERHASCRPMAREEEFLRRRNWAHLSPAEARSWLDTGGFGYLGHCAPLLQIALIAQLETDRLPAIGCARSLWRHSFVCSRSLPVIRHREAT